MFDLQNTEDQKKRRKRNNSISENNSRQIIQLSRTERPGITADRRGNEMRPIRIQKAEKNKMKKSLIKLFQNLMIKEQRKMRLPMKS